MKHVKSLIWMGVAKIARQSAVTHPGKAGQKE
jgi:hypothetical protein